MFIEPSALLDQTIDTLQTLAAYLEDEVDVLVALVEPGVRDLGRQRPLLTRAELEPLAAESAAEAPRGSTLQGGVADDQRADPEAALGADAATAAAARAPDLRELRRVN